MATVESQILPLTALQLHPMGCTYCHPKAYKYCKAFQQVELCDWENQYRPVSEAGILQDPPVSEQNPAAAPRAAIMAAFPPLLPEKRYSLDV